MPTDSPEADHVTISELIAHVTSELAQARRDAAADGKDPSLLLQSVTLSLTYEVSKTLQGGVDLKVAKTGGERQRSMGNEIVLTFKAVEDQAFPAGTLGPFGNQGPAAPDLPGRRS